MHCSLNKRTMEYICLACFSAVIMFCQNTKVRSHTTAITGLQMLLEKDPGTAVQEFLDRMEKQHYQVTETELDSLGYHLIHQNRIPEAVAVFQINVKLNSDSWKAWDSLGEGYMYAGDEAACDEAYARSLKINPENRNAAKQRRNIAEFIQGMAGETRSIPRFSPGQSTGIDESYFGEEPPVATPKVFAPGLVSIRGNLEYSCTFSPDGREMFFTARIGKNIARMFTSRWEKNGWTYPDVPEYSKGHIDYLPYIMPDGERLFFGRIKKDENGAFISKGMYVMDKSPKKPFDWSAPYLFEDGRDWMHVSATRHLTIYTTYMVDHRTTRFELVDSMYPQAESLTGGLHPGGHPSIAPDESFVIFDSERDGGFGAGDLWVSFRKKDGTWGPGINLGSSVNSEGNESIPHMTPDGQYLFYTANRDIYWVSTAFIDGLRPDGHKN